MDFSTFDCLGYELEVQVRSGDILYSRPYFRRRSTTETHESILMKAAKKREKPNEFRRYYTRALNNRVSEWAFVVEQLAAEWIIR